MRLIRVYVEAALAAGARVEFQGAAAEHVTRVLRLGAGDAVTLFNGDGSITLPESMYYARVQSRWRCSGRRLRAPSRRSH